MTPDNPEWLQEFEVWHVSLYGCVPVIPDSPLDTARQVAYLARARKDAEELAAARMTKADAIHSAALANIENENLKEQLALAQKELATAKESAEYAWKNTHILEAARQEQDKKLLLAQLDLQRCREVLESMVNLHLGKLNCLVTESDRECLNRVTTESLSKAKTILATPIDTTALAQHDAEVLREVADKWENSYDYSESLCANSLRELAASRTAAGNGREAEMNCPKCRSDDIDRMFHQGTGAAPECYFFSCNECEHKWGHG